MADPARLVEIYSGAERGLPAAHHVLSRLPVDLRERADAFAGVAAHAFVRGVLSTGGKPLLVTGEAVTANYFDVLGVRRRSAAASVPRRTSPRAAPVAVVSHGLWQRRSAAGRTSSAQTVKLSGSSYTVIGVAPRGFPGTMPGIATEFWVPVTMVERLQFTGVQWTTDNDPGATRLERRGTRWLFVKGRLADGRTVDQARAQAETVFARLRGDYPGHQREGDGERRAGRRASASIRCSTATCGRRARACSRRSAWCCSSRAPTWRTCCWRAAPRAGARSRFARRSAPAAAG